eukprot:202567-Pleurochrysis_carterae.AAC.3
MITTSRIVDFTVPRSSSGDTSTARLHLARRGSASQEHYSCRTDGRNRARGPYAKKVAQRRAE